VSAGASLAVVGGVLAVSIAASFACQSRQVRRDRTERAEAQLGRRGANPGVIR
jgi:hypothetical protein